MCMSIVIRSKGSSIISKDELYVIFSFVSADISDDFDKIVLCLEIMLASKIFLEFFWLFSLFLDVQL